MQRIHYVAGITASDKIVYMGFMCSLWKSSGKYMLRNWEKVEGVRDSKMCLRF
jgi:hypothetical protein